VVNDQSQGEQDREKDDDFCLGTVVGLHGLDGSLKLRSQLNNPSLLQTIQTVTIRHKSQPDQTATVTKIKMKDSHIAVSLAEFPDRTSAQQLMGCTVHTRRSQFGQLDSDEFWVRDLVGMEVYTTDGAHVGTVCSVMSGANELLEIRLVDSAEGKTALVPFAQALVPVVDLKNRRIEIANLPGLIE
jgi:16S rRNA processing protein RimM